MKVYESVVDVLAESSWKAGYWAGRIYEADQPKLAATDLQATHLEFKVNLDKAIAECELLMDLARDLARERERGKRHDSSLDMPAVPGVLRHDGEGVGEQRIKHGLGSSG